MRHKKMIQEILGTELEKQGFTYMPNSSWSCERVKDQVSNRQENILIYYNKYVRKAL